MEISRDVSALVGRPDRKHHQMNWGYINKILQFWKYLSSPPSFIAQENWEGSFLSLLPHPHSCCGLTCLLSDHSLGYILLPCLPRSISQLQDVQHLDIWKSVLEQQHIPFKTSSNISWNPKHLKEVVFSYLSVTPAKIFFLKK